MKTVMVDSDDCDDKGGWWLLIVIEIDNDNDNYDDKDD